MNTGENLPDSSHTQPGRSLDLAFCVCALAALLPIWTVKYLPMTDLPQHAAQIFMWSHINDPGLRLRDTYELNWFTPYLLGYATVGVLGWLMPLFVALKVVITLSVLGTPAALRHLLRTADANQWWSLLGFPAAFGFSFYWGFLNYLVAIPLGLLFLALVVRHGRSPSKRTSTLVATSALLLLVAHVLVLGICGLAACCIVIANTSSRRERMLRLLPLAAPVLLVGAWSVTTRARESQVSVPTVWNVGLFRIFELPALIFAVPDRQQAVAAFGLAVGLAVIAGGRVARQRWRWLPLVATLVVFLLAPHRGFGTYFLYQRFAVWVLLFGVLAIDADGKGLLRQKLFHVSLALLVVVWLMALAVRHQAVDVDARQFDGLLTKMEPNKRVLSLSFLRENERVIGAPFLHFPAWYQAEKGGVLGFSFAVFFPEIVRYRPGHAPRMTMHLEWEPQLFQWARDGDYDYFVVHAATDLGRVLFARANAPVTLELQAGRWWLYRKRVPGGRE